MAKTQLDDLNDKIKNLNSLRILAEGDEKLLAQIQNLIDKTISTKLWIT
jgi:hypothetical protein|tara:strand:+ start:5427 stop:5573 length:147 start_codon:yes stop_codon:yes gene_type:complete